jgi:hypothetical protein
VKEKRVCPHIKKKKIERKKNLMHLIGLTCSKSPMRWPYFSFIAEHPKKDGRNISFYRITIKKNVENRYSGFSFFDCLYMPSCFDHRNNIDLHLTQIILLFK